jgi:hypothetical protein
MSNEFEPDFDLDAEFQDDLSEFDDFIDDEDTVTLRTAVLQKNKAFAMTTMN